jgi:hypothetical protein
MALEEDEEGTSYAVTLRSYKGAGPLLNIERLETFFAAPMPEPLQKSGAAGRPSCLYVAMKEHERRKGAGETASSREVEAKELEAWVRKTYPNGPSLKAKTILNKLPKSFQPYNGRFPK